MPTLSETMAELESYGSPNIRKIWINHGLGENIFGVKYGDMKPFAKRLKINHTLALELWDTGNHDARILACMIADPAQASVEMLTVWGDAVANKGISDEISKFAVTTPHAQQMAGIWSHNPDEWIATAGWHLVGQLALKDKALPDAYFESYIEQIEREIHGSPNYTRYAMNGALIAIGTRSANLNIQALAAAEAIGEVIVDHGKTNCETPDATAYIHKTVSLKGYTLK